MVWMELKNRGWIILFFKGTIFKKISKWHINLYKKGNLRKKKTFSFGPSINLRFSKIKRLTYKIIK